MSLAIPGSETYELMVGRGNTAGTIKDRIDAVQKVIIEVIDNDQS